MKSSKSTTRGTQSSFICACQEWQRFACAGSGFYKEFEGKQYCVLHYPNKEKIHDFAIEIQKRLKNKNFAFAGGWFPLGTYFYQFHFVEKADFSQATFATFADFAEVVFAKEVNFYGAQFLDDAIFHNAIFHNDADFKFAQFHSEVDFNHTYFAQIANFSHAQFMSQASFTGSEDKRFFGEKAQLSLQHARVVSPEQILFQNLQLHPYWFIGIDIRNFVFADVIWQRNVNHDISQLSKLLQLSHIQSSSYALLATSYRQLAVNAEENQRYEEASNFRYDTMDVYRRKTWRGLAFWQLNWWYWILSGYGERVGRAAVVLCIMLALFVGFYTQVLFEHPIYTAGRPLEPSLAILYTLEVGALQNPDPKPFTLAARYLVLAETILVPFQVALIALAIRRKFMR